MESLIYEVVRHVATAINPDTGEVRGLDREKLLDLCFFAGDEIKDFPELLEILEAVKGEQRVYESWRPPSDGAHLTASTGWTEEDALLVLKHPSLAEMLSERIRAGFHPKIEIVYTKEQPPILAEPPEDEESGGPASAYALAAVALARADAQKYGDLIRRLVEHVSSVSRRRPLPEWPLDEIINVGQATKVVAPYAEDRETKRQADGFVEVLKKEAFQRFLRGHGKMNLHWKVEIAHLISPGWRSYPDREVPHADTATPVEEVRMGMPEQRIALAPGDRDITGAALEEDRRLYKTALHRALEEIKASGKSPEKRTAQMECLLHQWHEFLFDSHKGGYLQPYEKELRKDHDWALNEVKKGSSEGE